jgi:NADP-dependent 3-hydroxy acid dehydrogenase YdfG
LARCGERHACVEKPSEVQMARPLGQQVVVVLGASSGVGRETALRFAEHGASVVLAARRAAR